MLTDVSEFENYENLLQHFFILLHKYCTNTAKAGYVLFFENEL